MSKTTKAPFSGLVLGIEPSGDSPMGFSVDRAPPTEATLSNLVTYDGDAHAQVFAPTGAGKGVGFIVPNLLLYDGPAVVVDVKGENYAICGRRRREMGRQVVCIDPFGVVTKKSDRFNPLDLVDLPGSSFDSDAETLAAALAVEHTFASDRYWEDTGASLITGLLAHVATSNESKKRTLNALREMLFQSDLDYALATMMDNKSVKSRLAAECFTHYLNTPSDKTRPCVLSTACTFLRSLGSDAVVETLGPSTFSLEDWVAGAPIDIFLVIPPHKLESHKGLLRIWLSALMLAAQKRNRVPPKRTLFVVDEAATLGTLSLLKTAQVLLRGFGMQVISIWQDLAQLKQLYQNEWATMINNSAAILTFGFRNYAMARDWADVLGVEPAHLMKMAPDEQMALIDGHGVRKLQRLDYRRDKIFAGLWDPNPRFEKAPLPATPSRNAKGRNVGV